MRQRLLLVTATTMNEVDGGQVMFKSIVGALGSEHVSWIACGGDNASCPPWMSRFPHAAFVSPLFNRYLRAAAVRTPLRAAYLRHMLVRFPKRMFGAAFDFARRQRPTKLWVHASGPAIYLAQALAAELQLPVHTSFQDDAYGHLSEIGRICEPYFAKLIGATTSADVASDAMRELYEGTYSVKLNAQTLFLGSADAAIPAPPSVQPNARRIAYAGNVWCPDAFTAFCDALAPRSNQDDRFTVTIFSATDRWGLARRYPFVEFRGLVPSEKMPAVLSEYDLLYCPMAFSEHQRRTSQYSMPGKTFTYLQAQVPIVFHGPEYASNVRFARQHGIGLPITSQQPAMIREALTAYAHDQQRRAAEVRRARELFSTRFHPRTVLESFVELLDS